MWQQKGIDISRESAFVPKYGTSCLEAHFGFGVLVLATILFNANNCVGRNLTWNEDLLDQSRVLSSHELRVLIINSADDVLTDGLEYSVTQNIASSPISSDPRDYYSTHAYWWPNPETDDGLPYILKVGQVNPESRQDIDQLTGVYLATLYCALAYHLTGLEEYAQHGSELVNVFFLDPVKGMNPNFEYSKIIPGVDEIGTFEVATLSNRVRKLWDAMELMRPSPHWTEQIDGGMKDWSVQFLDWMETSPKAVKEFEGTNNHSTAYHLIAAILAKFSGNQDKALAYGHHFVSTLVPLQFAADGSQPLEMVRTDNLFYHVYNLKSAVDLLSVVNDLGLDFSGHLVAPINFLTPFLSGESEWQYWPDSSYPHNLKWEHDLLIEAATVLHKPELHNIGLSIYPAPLVDQYVWPLPRPKRTQLSVRNYPNPYNAGTWVQYTLAVENQVLVEVFDVSGKRVRRFQEGYQMPGVYSVFWNGKDDHATNLPAGTYIFRVRAGQLEGCHKTILLK